MCSSDLGELGAVEGTGWPRHTAGGTVACVSCLSGARDGTGTCLVRARGGVAHAGVVGRLGMVLVGRGDGGAVHARKVLDSGSAGSATASAGRVRGQA